MVGFIDDGVRSIILLLNCRESFSRLCELLTGLKRTSATTSCLVRTAHFLRHNILIRLVHLYQIIVFSVHWCLVLVINKVFLAHKGSHFNRAVNLWVFNSDTRGSNILKVLSVRSQTFHNVILLGVIYLSHWVLLDHFHSTFSIDLSQKCISLSSHA